MYSKIQDAAGHRKLHGWIYHFYTSTSDYPPNFPPLAGVDYNVYDETGNYYFKYAKVKPGDPDNKLTLDVPADCPQVTLYAVYYDENNPEYSAPMLLDGLTNLCRLLIPVYDNYFGDIYWESIDDYNRLFINDGSLPSYPGDSMDGLSKARIVMEYSYDGGKTLNREFIYKF